MMNKYSCFPTEEISIIAEKESWRKEINRPIYHIHKYWAQRLGSVFRGMLLYLMEGKKPTVWDDFYKTHCFSDTIVLDPFMGSGTTIGESIKLGAKAVGCDINPVSTFLVKQALTRVSLDSLEQAYNWLAKRVAPRIQEYYRTIDSNGKTELASLYYFWVKLVETPNGEKVPLFSRYVFAQNAYAAKKPAAHIVCPHCYNIFQGKYNDTISVCPQCNFSFNPQKGPAGNTTITDSQGTVYKIKDLIPANKTLEEKMYAVLAIDSAGNKKYLPIRDFDLNLYEKAKNDLQRFEGFLPYYPVREGYNTDQARGYNYFNWRDFFNPRQLLCLGMLLKEIMQVDDKPIREQLLCLFSSSLEFNNMFCSYKGEGTGAVRPLFSNHIIKPERTPLENSVWGYSSSSGCFSSLYKSRLLRAKEYLDKPFELIINTENGDCSKVVASAPMKAKIRDTWKEFKEDTGSSALILNGDSTSLPIPSHSIDFVVTDPPYFDFIHYSELSDFFYAWLSPVLKAEDASFLDVSSGRDNEVQQTDATIFSNLLGGVFSECNRVLKPQGELAFSFHHSRVDGWYAIANAIRSSGLSVEECIPVHAELMASTPKASAKEPISIDAMIVCGKKAENRDLSEAAEIALYYVQQIKKGKPHMSKNDIFVVCASQCLVTMVSRNQSISEATESVSYVMNYVLERM